mmetsp:Transcript_2550/g.5948  ORF Transcript_2550/g.5948 Transcript_2550/m.5948 type:complete len:200 (+) Transcript_2550:121-720(+)
MLMLSLMPSNSSCGSTLACWMIFCVSYRVNPENSASPPYNEMLCMMGTAADAAGRNMGAIELTTTTPRPIASGPPMYKNFSDGELAAMRDSEPTSAPVYTAALSTMGPPSMAMGASDTPMAALNNAKDPSLSATFSFGVARHSIIEPMPVASVAPISIIGDMRAITFTTPMRYDKNAEPAVSTTPPPNAEKTSRRRSRT